jgi:cytochrome c-type biogenesis protein CcmH
MSPRDSFWFLAGVLVAVAIMVTVRAWLRERPALGEASAGSGARRPPIPSFAVPVAAGLALVGVALGIYFLLGSPESIASSQATTAAAQPSHDMQMGQQPSPTAGSLDDVTNKLAARLAAQGGSDKDWELLAESYEYMGKAAEAKAARAHAASATPMAASSTAEGPTQASGDQIADLADAFDKPRIMTVANTTAGHSDAASGPTTGNAPTNTSAPDSAASGTHKAWPANGSSNGQSAAASGTGNAEISGTVEITSKLARQAKSGVTLFIYAKQPNVPGPPLAVLRVRAEHWPVTFTLNDGNAMVPGRNLSNANTVQIEARISKNGDALPASGDLVGSVTSVNPRDGHPVKISIDREIG